MIQNQITIENRCSSKYLHENPHLQGPKGGNTQVLIYIDEWVNKMCYMYTMECY